MFDLFDEWRVLYYCSLELGEKDSCDVPLIQNDGVLGAAIPVAQGTIRDHSGRVGLSRDDGWWP